MGCFIKALAVQLFHSIYVVGGLEHFFPINIGFLIIPIDFHIFQRGGPTTNQILNLGLLARRKSSSNNLADVSKVSQPELGRAKVRSGVSLKKLLIARLAHGCQQVFI